MRHAVKAGRIAAIVLMLALPLGAVAQSGAQPPAPLVVVPGLGVGQWTVDRHLADFVFALGDTIVADIRPSGTDLVFRPQLDEKSWSGPRIFVVYPHTSNVVWAVGTSEPDARTIDHVGIGSSAQQLTAAYHDPQMTLELATRSRTLIYDTLGIAFEFQYAPESGQFSPTVGRVVVFRPGQGKAIWRVP